MESSGNAAETAQFNPVFATSRSASSLNPRLTLPAYAAGDVYSCRAVAGVEGGNEAFLSNHCVAGISPGFVVGVCASPPDRCFPGPGGLPLVGLRHSQCGCDDVWPGQCQALLRRRAQARDRGLAGAYVCRRRPPDQDCTDQLRLPACARGRARCQRLSLHRSRPTLRSVTPAGACGRLSRLLDNRRPAPPPLAH